MAGFIELATSFPTAVWSTLLVVVVGYWLIALVSGIGPGDGADAGDAGDGDGGHDSDGAHGGHFFQALGTGVPITIVISLVVMKGWAASMLAQWLLGPWGASLSGLVGVMMALVLFLGIAVAALWITGFTVRPLRPLFTVVTEHGQRHLIGKLVSITSSQVSETFGTAVHISAESKGAEHLLNVVREAGSPPLAQGETAVVVDYRESDNTYIVRKPSLPVPSDDAGLVEQSVDGTPRPPLAPADPHTSNRPIPPPDAGAAAV